MDKKNSSYEAFIADLPRGRTHEFHSPEELEEALAAAGVYQPTRQLSKGEFRAHLAVTETESAYIFLDRYSTALSLYLEPPKDAVGFLFPRHISGEFVANGIGIDDDTLVAFPRSSGLDISGGGPIGSDCLAINESKFWSIADAVCPGLERQTEVAFVQGDVKQLNSIRDRLVELGATPEPGTSDLDVLRLIADLIFWIAKSHDTWPSDMANTHAARVRVAKRAQDYIEAHYREAVHIKDLCRVTCVGARTLQRCFDQYFNLTVSKYLKILRLDSARRELAAADSESTSVTSIAMENGCNHLGRFSVEYRQHFGESPRETLATLARHIP
ncbi:MAG: helix-turn-helix domain-containing protein [Woeseiaceae bacterium]